MDDDTDEFDRALSQVVPIVDTVRNRLLLARAVVILRDAGKISRKVAALAILELDRQTSTFFMSSVAESLSLLAGDRRTPSGLLVAAHSVRARPREGVNLALLARALSLAGSVFDVAAPAVKDADELVAMMHDSTGHYGPDDRVQPRTAPPPVSTPIRIHS